MDIQIDRKVPAVMADGTTLYSDVYRPKAPGRYPVIVERVAYELDSRLAPYAEWYAQRGYVFVGQNSRGTYGSEGEFDPFADDGWGENRDGYETIEWAAAQQWSNGNVGTMDGSWSGLTQNLLAPTRPPHLRTMFLRMAPARRMGIKGGIPVIAFRMFWASQFLQQAKHSSANDTLRAAIPELEKTLANPAELLARLPAGELPVIDKIAPQVGRLMRRSVSDPFFDQIDATMQVSQIDVPILHLGGWFDNLLSDTLAMFTGVRASGFSESARDGQRLLIGPWVHGPMEPDNSAQGDLEYGPEASLGINQFRLRWFDYWLKGDQNGLMELPQVRLFVMGPNHWRDFDSWPPPSASEVKLFLHRETDLAGAAGLKFDKPEEEDSSTSFDYDPFDPVPAHSGAEGSKAAGPIDLAPSEGRKIVFTSAPLKKPLTVIGPITARLYAKSSARDTDWFVTLTDVYPDGRSIRVQEGALRARYREGLDHESLMEPGKPYLFEVDMVATAQVFAPGHCVRVAITSSRFPPMERNMNTGGVNQDETTGVVAHNTVLHDRNHPSHVALSVLK